MQKMWEIYKLCEYCHAAAIHKSLDFCDSCYNYLEKNGIKWLTKRELEEQQKAASTPKFETMVLKKLSNIENLLKELK